MKQFFAALRVSKSSRPGSARRPSFRPQLEALEARLTPSTVHTAVLKTDGELDLYNAQTGVFQTLSPAGTIASVSAAETAGGQTVVFAVVAEADAGGNLNTLWEYNTANGVWNEISVGSFQQVSAATNATGDAVVFGVLGQGAYPGYANSLWEYTGGGWRELANAGFNIPAYPFAVPSQPTVTLSTTSIGNVIDPAPTWLWRNVLSVSAVGTAQGEVAFAITTDHTLWQYTPSDGWAQLSTGSFQQVSAGLDANGKADVFGVLTDTSLWEFDNGGWSQLPGPVIYADYVGYRPSIGPSTYTSVAAGLNGEEFGVASDHTLWQNNQELSPGSFAQISATQTSAGADVVFGTLTDGSLWEYTSGPGVTTGWTELLSGGVASTATPL